MTLRGDGIIGWRRSASLLPALVLSVCLMISPRSAVQAQLFSDRPPPVPPAVQAFAREQGAAELLPGALDLTRRVFPDARRVEVVLEDDPEIVNDRHIVLDVYASTTVPQALDAYRRWNDGMSALCPVPLSCLFRLNLHQGE